MLAVDVPVQDEQPDAVELMDNKPGGTVMVTVSVPGQTILFVSITV